MAISHVSVTLLYTQILYSAIWLMNITIYLLDDHPTLKDLCKNLLPDLAPHWESFAIEVELDKNGSILGIIEQQCLGDREACCRMLFRKWLQQEKPTWWKVIECLREANCTQLANDVEEKVTRKKKAGESGNMDSTLYRIICVDSTDKTTSRSPRKEV